MSTPYSIQKAAQQLGVHPKTLQRWDRDGVLVARRTGTNRRYYLQEQIDAFLRKEKPVLERKLVAYCRVSTHAQKVDLQNQQKQVGEFCTARGYVNVEMIAEIGGGLNFKRSKFLKLIQDIVEKRVAVVVIAHKDRLVRFGFDLVQHLCALSEVELMVLNQEHLSPEREMVEDMLSIVHCFSARLYGLRSYKKTIKQALLPVIP